MQDWVVGSRLGLSDHFNFRGTDVFYRNDLRGGGDAEGRGAGS